MRNLKSTAEKIEEEKTKWQQRLKFITAFRLTQSKSFFTADIFPAENYPYFYPSQNLNQTVSIYNNGHSQLPEKFGILD